MFNAEDLKDVEEQQDRLGGSYTLESGVYDATVKLAYIVGSQSSKSKCMVCVFDIDGFELTTREWFLTGAGAPTYEKNNKKFMLPAYEKMNDLHLVTTGYDLTGSTVEDKTIKVWDADAGGEIDKNMPVVTSILNKRVSMAVLKVIENKQEKDESSGKYVPTEDKREVNEISKFFHIETGKTVVELKNKVDLPPEDLFKARWADKNTGKTQDRYKEPNTTGPARSGTGSPASNSKPSSTSLFG